MSIEVEKLFDSFLALPVEQQREFFDRFIEFIRDDFRVGFKEAEYMVPGRKPDKRSDRPERIASVLSLSNAEKDALIDEIIEESISRISLIEGLYPVRFSLFKDPQKSICFMVTYSGKSDGDLLAIVNINNTVLRILHESEEEYTPAADLVNMTDDTKQMWIRSVACATVVHYIEILQPKLAEALREARVEALVQEKRKFLRTVRPTLAAEGVGVQTDAEVVNIMLKFFLAEKKKRLNPGRQPRKKKADLSNLLKFYEAAYSTVLSA